MPSSAQGYFKNLQIGLSHDPATPLLSLSPKAMNKWAEEPSACPCSW